MKRLLRRLRHMSEYAVALAKWLAVGGIIGVIGGLIGTLFHIGVEEATLLRENHHWLLYLLPVAGLVIVALYRFSGMEGKGTNAVIESVHFGKKVSSILVPVIFLSTVLTHLCGGSAGREGAALQIGGGIGHKTGRLLHLGEKDMPLATLCGMSALFAALFGTPLTATVFALEVVSVGVFYYAGLVPCITSAMTAFLISRQIGVVPTRLSVMIPQVEPVTMLQVIGLAALCGLISILFCRSLHAVEHKVEHLLPNPWLRAVVGGALLIGLTFLVGSADYNGAGMGVIERAVAGEADPFAWIWKLIFTLITISFGFKGGEVVPSFFIGATFGCVAGGLLGLPPGLGAAVGLISVFCGAVNCPIASTLLAMELFGTGEVLYFAMACAVSYLVSGYSGLYSSQTILYSKLRAEFINVKSK